MKITPSNFMNYGEIDCGAHNKVIKIQTTGALPPYRLSIRKIGKDKFQVYAKFAQPMLLIHDDNGQTLEVEEVTLLEGSLTDVVTLTNEITGGKDTVSLLDDEPPEKEKEVKDPVKEQDKKKGLKEKTPDK